MARSLKKAKARKISLSLNLFLSLQKKRWIVIAVDSEHGMSSERLVRGFEKREKEKEIDGLGALGDEKKKEKKRKEKEE